MLQFPKPEEIRNKTHLGTRDSEGETAEDFSAPSKVLAQNTLFEIPSDEQNPDRKMPIEGCIFTLRLGTEGV